MSWSRSTQSALFKSRSPARRLLRDRERWAVLDLERLGRGEYCFVGRKPRCSYCDNREWQLRPPANEIGHGRPARCNFIRTSMRPARPEPPGRGDIAGYSARATFVDPTMVDYYGFFSWWGNNVVFDLNETGVVTFTTTPKRGQKRRGWLLDRGRYHMGREREHYVYGRVAAARSLPIVVPGLYEHGGRERLLGEDHC